MPDEFTEMGSKETMLAGRGPGDGGFRITSEGIEYSEKVIKSGIFFKTTTVSTYIKVAPKTDNIVYDTERVQIGEPRTTKNLSTSGKIIIIAAVGGLATGIADAFGAFDN